MNENNLNVKRCHAIRLKFEETFLISLAKLMLESKASICSTIKDKLYLYMIVSFRDFLFVIKNDIF